MSLSDNYQRILEAQEKASWNLAEAILDIELDFSKRFMPAGLQFSDEVGFLDEQERKIFNQIQGYSYAHLFQFVEEFIIREIHERSRDQLGQDRAALRVLLSFCEEEVKHQELFAAFKSSFEKGFGRECQLIQGADEVADAILQCSPMAVMLFVNLLEWATQRHYIIAFRSESGLDPSFCQLFHLHWMEEVQHARADALVLDKMQRGAPQDVRQRALDDLCALCEQLLILLDRQAELDAKNLDSVLEKGFDPDQLDFLRKTAFRAYRLIFLEVGFGHPKFQSNLELVLPGAVNQFIERFQLS